MPVSSAGKQKTPQKLGFFRRGVVRPLGPNAGPLMLLNDVVPADNVAVLAHCIDFGLEIYNIGGELMVNPSAFRLFKDIIKDKLKEEALEAANG